MKINRDLLVEGKLISNFTTLLRWEFIWNSKFEKDRDKQNLQSKLYRRNEIYPQK